MSLVCPLSSTHLCGVESARDGRRHHRTVCRLPRQSNSDKTHLATVCLIPSFAFLVNSYGTVAIFVYVLIAISQLRLRARLEREAPERLTVKMWAYPYLTYVAILGMISIVVAMAFIPDQRTPLILGTVSLTILMLAYVVRLYWGRR